MSQELQSMAENKKAFILYCDIIHTVRKMPKDKAGELFMTILSYVNDENPAPGDLIVDLTFEPIKQQLKRDLKKYEQFIERQRENGKRGGRPKEPTKRVGLSGKPKKADTVIDTDTVIDIVEWDSIKNNFKNDFRWKEKFCRDKDLKLPDLEKRMVEFINDIELREQFKPLKDLKDHFTNTFNLKKRINGKESTDPQPSELNRYK